MNSAGRNRKNLIKFYLSDDEKKLLDYKMKKYGFKSKSRFIKELVTYGFVYNVDYSPILENTILLNKIGNNINQIAHKVNVIGAPCKEELDYIKKQMDKIYLVQKETLMKDPILLS